MKRLGVKRPGVKRPGVKRPRCEEAAVLKLKYLVHLYVATEFI